MTWGLPGRWIRCTFLHVIVFRTQCLRLCAYSMQIAAWLISVQVWCSMHNTGALYIMQKNKPLFIGTLLCACMCIDNMDVGHRVLLALIAEQELQHSGLDSTHGWKIEPRDKTWSFVAFCASAVCTRSGTGVKQTQLPQQNEVTHQQVWRWQWVKTYAGEKNLNFGKAMARRGHRIFCLVSDEKRGGERSVAFSILPLCHSLLEHPPQSLHVSILQSLSCNLQQPCIYGVVHNLWRFYTQNKVLRQKRPLFHHSELAVFHPGLLHLYCIL